MPVKSKRILPMGCAPERTNRSVLAKGLLPAAKPYLERALNITETVLGPQHPAIAQSLNCLTSLLQTMDDFQAARNYYCRTFDILIIGPENWTTWEDTE